MQFQSKFQLAFLQEIDTLILTFIWKCKRSGITKAKSLNEDKVGELTIPDFKA